MRNGPCWGGGERGLKIWQRALRSVLAQRRTFQISTACSTRSSVGCGFAVASLIGKKAVESATHREEPAARSKEGAKMARLGFLARPRRVVAVCVHIQEHGSASLFTGRNGAKLGNWRNCTVQACGCQVVSPSPIHCQSGCQGPRKRKKRKRATRSSRRASWA